MKLNWDVLIPAYNASEHLQAAISSVVDQSHQPLQVVVCDDASQDTTAAVAAAQPSVTLVQNAVNYGVGETRQVLLTLANAEWVLYLDADDQLLPGAAGIFAAAVAARPDAVVHAFAEVAPENVSYQVPGPPAEPARVSHRDLLWGNPICSSATLIRRDAALAVGGFTKARRLIDYCIWFRIARVFPTGIILHKEPVVRRLISVSTITGNVNAAVIEEARLLSREWWFTYGSKNPLSEFKRQLRLTTLWLRGLSRHVDYGKPASEYVEPKQLSGYWRAFQLLGCLKTRFGLYFYAGLRRAAALGAQRFKMSSSLPSRESSA
ncbi:glycosyltransferase [Arthrobacter sp. CC3]|uniref:glycosyltransferase family 2 protein n=1 Tax=Arthrobacter sp. CC3 TaxID=3029185 RepID=UPI003267D3C8